MAFLINTFAMRCGVVGISDTRTPKPPPPFSPKARAFPEWDIRLAKEFVRFVFSNVFPLSVRLGKPTSAANYKQWSVKGRESGANLVHMDFTSRLTDIGLLHIRY
jgi:hypothetical protein